MDPLRDDCVLWRAQVWEVTKDDPQRPGARILSGGGFSPSSDGSGMSCDICDTRQQRDAFYRRWPAHFGIAEITAGALRALGLVVERDPLPDNECHVQVLGTKARRLAKAVAKAATLIRQPTQVP